VWPWFRSPHDELAAKLVANVKSTPLVSVTDEIRVHQLNAFKAYSFNLSVTKKPHLVLTAGQREGLFVEVAGAYVLVFARYARPRKIRTRYRHSHGQPSSESKSRWINELLASLDSRDEVTKA
jgi:hypothetical protein